MRALNALIGALALMGNVAYASPQNALTLDPLTLVFTRAIALEYERGFGPVGVHVGTSLLVGDLELSEFKALQSHSLGFGFQLGLRYYPWSKALKGAYINPYAAFSHTQMESEVPAIAGEDGVLSQPIQDSLSGWGWSVGAVVGWAWVLGDSFAFSLAGGAGWCETRLESKNGTRLNEKGFCPTLRVAVGAAF